MSQTTAPSRCAPACGWPFTPTSSTRVDTAQEVIDLAAHSCAARNVEGLLGRFFDVAWAYRFGPPQQDVVVVSLESESEGDSALISQAMRFPAGRPVAVESAARLGLRGGARVLSDGSLGLHVRSDRLAYGVRVRIPGFTPSDDAFSVEPGGERVVPLRPLKADATFAGGALTAVNLRGTVPVVDETDNAFAPTATPHDTAHAPAGGDDGARRGDDAGRPGMSPLEPARALYLSIDGIEDVFGLLHLPAQDTLRQTAVLICPPFGGRRPAPTAAGATGPRAWPEPDTRRSASICRGPATVADRPTARGAWQRGPPRSAPRPTG